MKLVTLGDVVTVKGGGTPRKTVASHFDGGIPWVTPKDMKRPIINSTKITLSDDGVKNSPAKLVPSGAVLIVVRSGVLKHTLPVAQAAVPVTLNQDMKALIPDKTIDSTYLARLLKARERAILGWVRATTADNFPIQKLLELQIALPTLEEQRRIAAIIDQADDLRAKRRQVLAHLDALTQSIFHEMFGRCSTADERPLSALATVTSGITKGRRTSDVTFDTPYLAVSNVQAGHLVLDVVKEIAATEAEIQRYALADGDLVLTEGGDPDKLGRGTVWRNELPLCLHQNHIFRVRIDDRLVLLPEFLSGYLNDSRAKRYFLRSAKQTTGIASINMTQLKALPVPVPPMSDQQEYLRKILAVTNQAGFTIQGAETLDALLASLQSRAFRGDL